MFGSVNSAHLLETAKQSDQALDNLEVFSFIGVPRCAPYVFFSIPSVFSDDCKHTNKNDLPGLTIKCLILG